MLLLPALLQLLRHFQRHLHILHLERLIICLNLGARSTTSAVAPGVSMDKSKRRLGLTLLSNPTPSTNMWQVTLMTILHPPWIKAEG